MGNLEHILRGIMNQFEEKTEKVEFVGHITKELSEELIRNRKALKIEKEIIEKKVELYIAQLKKEHDLDAFSIEQEKLWDKVYDHLGLSEKQRESDYTINQDTLIVSRYINENVKEAIKTPLQ